MEQEPTKEERELLQGLLLHGETLKWIGRPQARYFDALSAVMFILAFPVAGFTAAFLLPLMMEEDMFALLVAVFSLPSWIMVLFLLTAPLRHRRKMLRTLYAITPQRAIVCTRKAFGKLEIKKFPLAKDMVKEYKMKPDGSGDLVLGYEEKPYHDDHGNARHLIPVGFMALPRLNEVQNILMDILEENQTNTPDQP